LEKIKNNLNPKEFQNLKKILISEYRDARKNITKKDWLRSQFDPKHQNLINIASFAEKVLQLEEEKENPELLKNALLLTPAGNSEEAISLCKRYIDKSFIDVTYEDSYLLRKLSAKAVGEIVGDENNEKYTKIIWQDSLIGKNLFGVQIRNRIYCEVFFEKTLNEKGKIKYSSKIGKLLVGNTRIE
jgi:hypothetical protein